MSHPDLIYLDHNATTPVDPEVLEAMLPYFTEIYGNAASIDHEAGHIAKRAVEKARESCAAILNAKSAKEIIFTSGATESDNMAIFGVAEMYADKGDHIITCVTEHKAVLDCCARLEAMGKSVTYLPVDQYGFIDLAELEAAITPQTILISIMFANNEIGTIQPIAEIGAIAKKHDVIFHTDAAQAVGHVPIDVQAMNIDLLSFSGHKIYGPKGIGGLYVRRRSFPPVKLAPVIYGGGHEHGLRPGTLNVPGIVGMGKAVDVAITKMETENVRYIQLRQYILNEFSELITNQRLLVNGDLERRLPNNLNFSYLDIENRSLLVNLQEFALSSGSACTAITTNPSHVILALGYGDQRAHTALRIGFGRNTTLAHIHLFCESFLSKSKFLLNKFIIE